RCIVLFQKKDGMDVMLFGLNVFEYGEDCPEGNRGRSYMSYLDSVHYLKPSRARMACGSGQGRTCSALLIRHLPSCKPWENVHLSVCPPGPGDNLVFFCLPE
ncbi:unnamed protein product, partial [Scytosiphon promiscuus]